MRTFLLAVLVALQPACGAPTAPSMTSVAQSTPITGFSGHVVDFTTNMGLAAATVSFGDQSAITGPDGSYVLDVPMGEYEPTVNSVRVGLARVSGTSYRGDFLVRTGTCVGRYGAVTDRQSLKPISAATVSLGGQNATTGADGWYRIDLACPADGIIGFNTTFLYVSHHDYANASQVVGRGVYGVTRLDVELARK